MSVVGSARKLPKSLLNIHKKAILVIFQFHNTVFSLFLYHTHYWG